MTVDQEARDLARQAIARIEGHEDVCGVRWKGAMDQMAEVKRAVWAGFGLTIASLIGLVGWLANKAF